MSKDSVYEQNGAYEICFLKSGGVENIGFINISVRIPTEKVCDFKIQTEHSAQVVIYACSPVREVGVEVEEPGIESVEGIIDEINSDDAKVDKCACFSVIVEAMVAYPREIELDAIVPSRLGCPIVLVEPSTEVFKISCAIVACIG